MKVVIIGGTDMWEHFDTTAGNGRTGGCDQPAEREPYICILPGHGKAGCH